MGRMVLWITSEKGRLGITGPGEQGDEPVVDTLLNVDGEVAYPIFTNPLLADAAAREIKRRDSHEVMPVAFETMQLSLVKFFVEQRPNARFALDPTDIQNFQTMSAKEMLVELDRFGQGAISQSNPTMGHISRAIRILATHPGPIQIRLAAAAPEFAGESRPELLSPEDYREYKSILAIFKTQKGKLNSLAENEACAIVERMYALDFKLKDN